MASIIKIIIGIGLCVVMGLFLQFPIQFSIQHGDFSFFGFMGLGMMAVLLFIVGLLLIIWGIIEKK